MNLVVVVLAGWAVLSLLTAAVLAVVIYGSDPAAVHRRSRRRTARLPGASAAASPLGDARLDRAGPAPAAHVPEAAAAHPVAR